GDLPTRILWDLLLHFDQIKLLGQILMGTQSPAVAKAWLSEHYGERKGTRLFITNADHMTLSNATHTLVIKFEDLQFMLNLWDIIADDRVKKVLDGYSEDGLRDLLVAQLPNPQNVKCVEP